VKKRNQSGVTLLELLTVVVIIGVLTSVAIPSYRRYTMRAQRSDATAALLRIAAAQEKFYLQNNTYTTTIGAGGLNLGGTTNSERGWYSLTIAAPAGLTIGTGYLATASAIAGQAQATDTDCATFTVRETGERGAANSGGTSNTAACWR
jgi:type IV pilus assembly protein PilE